MFLILRFLTATIVITLILFILSKIKISTQESFNFTQSFLADFIGFSLIGVLLHTYNENNFRKSSWSVKLKPEMVIIVIIYLLIAISLVMRISFIITIFIDLNIQVSFGLIPFQILFGYTFIGLFFKRDFQHHM